MDAKIKKYCPCCSQFYHLQPMNSKSSLNIPLYLSCGHSMCETCVRNILKFAQLIECRICHQDMQVSSKDLELFKQNKISLYDLFPVNKHMIGELALQTTEPKNDNQNKTENDCFINIKQLIKSIDDEDGECVECHKPTSMMCEQCDIIVCINCFNKSHKTFVIFQKHALRAIVGPKNEPKNNCKSHPNKQLDYYCQDCSKPVCVDCCMVGDKTCKKHCILSMEDVNKNLFTELTEILPKVDEMFRRLTKTAFDIGNFLTKLKDNTNTNPYSILMNEIDAHFSKLNYIMEQQKDSATQQVLKLKKTEIDSLKKAKNDATVNLRKAKSILESIASLEPDKLQNMDLSSLLEEAKTVVKTPWCLKQQSDQFINVIVKEDLYTSITGSIQLKTKDNSQYRLYNTEELIEANEEIPAPPTSIVYPPELVKDVRQQSQPKNNSTKDNSKTHIFFHQAPKYRSKSGSCTSLNSNNSDTSHKAFQFHDNRPVVEPVTPLPDTQQPKQLVEGSKELIYISHIENPHNFYVQRAGQQARVQELMREFKNAVSYECPPEKHVTEGKIYLVYNKVDNLWQRCRIVSIDRRVAKKTIYHVFCIDFGSSDAVKIDKLRYIPLARIQSPPPFAINCSLANCEPITGAWTSDDSFLIQNIIDNKQAVIHINRVSCMPSGSVRLECDLIAFEDGVSVAHALAFHGRARLPANLPYPKMLGVSERPKLFISNHDCKKNSIDEVVITHIASPDHFYVRELHLLPEYEKLHENLEAEYSLTIKTGAIYLPEQNMACVANIKECDLGASWARAVVLELPGRARVRVLLVDIGAVVLLHWSALRRILTKFTMQRALARECYLAGVTPLNKKWSRGSVALLQSFQNRPLEMHVEDNRNRNLLGITLYDKQDELNVICINEQMIKNKFAVSFGFFMFNKKPEADELVFTNKPPLEKQIQQSKPKGFPLTVLKQEPTNFQKQNDGDLEAIDKGPLRLEAKILNYQSPSLLYVSLVHQQKLFATLFENIQKYYSQKKTPGKTDWEVGDRCCTICNQSQTWRRAVILELENENAKVFYSDFACVEKVPVLSLREITKELSSIGHAAIMCHLHGVIPAVGEEWPSLTKEFLKELLDAYNRFFITKLGKFKGKSMPIELWVYHTIQGGALEPNTSEWRCLNNKIIEQGLGIPDKQKTEKEKVTTDNAGDEVLSFLNITGSVRDWLQIEPMPLNPLTIKSDSESNTSTPVETDTSNEEFQSSNTNTVFVSDWLPSEPLPTNEFTATPTYIDNDGVIYLHDITQNDTLDLLRKALDVRFSHPDPKAKFVKWTIGEPCIALFFLDNRFYRGKVLEVNNDTCTCLIHYIDYGNEELCAFENLRKSIVLHQIPTQAHKCILSRIRPVNNHWDMQSLDYIHKYIVEKQCYVKVSGPPIGGHIPIEIKYNKLWINDHLVDLDLAVYTDGTKPIVRKFAPNVNETPKLEQSIESDSRPDYVVEYDEAVTDPTTASVSSFQPISYEGKDWVHIMDEEDSQTINDNFMTYSPYTKEKFKCNIDVLNELEKLELAIVHDDETAKAYENMFKQLQTEFKSMPALTSTHENKACLALFSDDDQWYRASILQYSEAKKRIKVKYVDYGNIDIISVADVKEISEKYARLPPGTLTVTLHGVKVNHDIERNKLIEHFKEIFLGKGPFDAEVIDDTNIVPSVELRNDDGQLIYERLIEQNVFIKCD